MKKLVGTVCIALLAAFSLASPASAKECKEEVFATGKASLTKVPGAYLSSLFAWRREAESRYGRKFRAWRNADARNIDCAKGSKDGKSGWICTRTAVPCRLGFGLAKKDPDLVLPNRTLRRGDKGQDVEILQRILNEAGYGLKVDGDYGSGTVKAVRDFQTQERIGVDGSVGPQTRNRLNKMLQG